VRKYFYVFSVFVGSSLLALVAFARFEPYFEDYVRDQFVRAQVTLLGLAQVALHQLMYHFTGRLMY
jgi:hypothetical protein